MLVFAQLRALAEFRRRHLPFLKTIEEHDLVREIGHHQVLGAPLTLKQLLLIGIGSVATVQRRLRRLKRLGVIRQSRSQADRRVIELTLGPDCMRAFGKYGILLAGTQTLSNAGNRFLNGQGRHLCALCDGDESSRRMAVGFLKEGLRQRHQCVLVGPPSFRDSTLAGLQRAGARRRPLAGQLILSGGEKSPESMLEFFRPVFEEARAAGKAVHLVGNMYWAHGKMDFDTLMDFEARVDALLRRFHVEALCQYDVRRFSGPQVLRALKCHPDTGRYPLMTG
jgi:MEDS: MEthanogen/methylotroph, DcmR Sensory domain